MNKENILYCLGILENGALNYYQAVETIRIASQNIQNYIEQLEKQNEKQKEVIDKAIEFINSIDLYSHEYALDSIEINDLLDILKEASE